MTDSKHIERFMRKNAKELENIQNTMQDFHKQPSVDVIETLTNEFGTKATSVVFRALDCVLIYMVGQFIIEHHVYDSFNGLQSYYRISRGAFHGVK